MDERFFRNVDFALGNLVDSKLLERPNFGGKPGEPVPAVDPEDLRIVWQIGKDMGAPHSGPKAVEGVIFEQACKPGADVEAVVYRATQIWMIDHIAPELLAQFTRDGQTDDAVFRAAAKVPMEWMGVGIIREGPPFDVNEFLRLCGRSGTRLGYTVVGHAIQVND